MKPVNNYESQPLSLLKSVVAEMVHQDEDYKGIPCEHPLMRGVDHYCQKVEQDHNISMPTKGSSETDPALIAYLAYLHHHKAHAHIADNPKIAKDLADQLASFTFGNKKWQSMFDRYVEYYWAYPMHTGGKPMYRSWRDHKYGNGSYNYGVIDWKIPSYAKVAIIGDIGTGTDVAAAVLLGALSFQPDVILHVGDVYYSGTREEFKRYFTGLIKAVFTDQGVSIPVYTLPGNHEYFTGAIPYFEVLDENVLVNSEEQRQQASFFKIETEDGGWQFLGMDTSYHGHFMGGPEVKMQKAVENLHLNPDKTYNPVVPPDMVYVRPDEVDWHHYHLNAHQGRTILLGHHQLYSFNQKVGIPQSEKDGKLNPLDYNRLGVNTRLWEAFGAYFEKVAAWFWGHEHNLCIFQDNYRPEGWPEASDAPDELYKTLTKGRCVGHAAIPVAEGENPYKVNNPVPLVRDDLKLDLHEGWYNRGFQIIQLNGKGYPAKASYYQVQGAEPEPLLIYEEKIV